MPLVQVGSAAKSKFLQVTAPQLAGWGLAVGTLAVFALERIPRLRMDVYSNIPILGRYSLWQSYKGWEYGG